MRVIHLSVECFPVAKVGGLADVVGALPKYQRKFGIDAAVVMPWYKKPFMEEHEFELIFEGSFFQGSEKLGYSVFKEKNTVLEFPLYFIHIPGKLDREEVYGYPDEAEQWFAFQHAFLDWQRQQEEEPLPDVVHCHDHHVGLIPFLLKEGDDFKKLADVKTVFTVHNGQYQGWVNWNKAILLPAFDTWRWGMLDWDGVINPLAAAIKATDCFTTVSEGYLQELYAEANGLQDLFYQERAKGYGIVNGIDVAFWNPETDKHIPFSYNVKDVNEQKLRNKRTFCAQFGLPADRPLLSFIGRFALEKGADFLAATIESLLEQHSGGLTVFILGSGDTLIQSQLAALAERYKGRIAVFFGYNEALAHEVYAASDMLLMPSRVEPCGLNQLYAMKYGTIPIVRAVGGLKDTVMDVRNYGYGFLFENLDVASITEAIERAITYFKDRNDWQAIRRKAMALDYSWDKSAQKYLNLYNQLLKSYDA
ncbi:glycogen synthase [Sphingobacterium sp. Mn56C]|uniref:glycogen synthase n=1 Tax=Sphingobacterium sp. Mn56C TaxID=3395261 RepID=UPI003BC63521